MAEEDSNKYHVANNFKKYLCAGIAGSFVLGYLGLGVVPLVIRSCSSKKSEIKAPADIDLENRIKEISKIDFRALKGAEKVRKLIEAEKVIEEAKKRNIKVSEYEKIIDGFLFPIECEANAEYSSLNKKQKKILAQDSRFFGRNTDKEFEEAVFEADYAIESGFDIFASYDKKFEEKKKELIKQRKGMFHTNPEFSEQLKELEMPLEQRLLYQFEKGAWDRADKTLKVLRKVYGADDKKYDKSVIEASRLAIDASLSFSSYERNKDIPDRKDFAVANLREGLFRARKAQRINENARTTDGQSIVDVISYYEKAEDETDSTYVKNKISNLYAGLDYDLFGNELDLEALAKEYIKENLGMRKRDFSSAHEKSIAELIKKLKEERIKQTKPTGGQKYAEILRNTAGLPFKLIYNGINLISGIGGALYSPFSSKVDASQQLKKSVEGIEGALSTVSEFAGASKAPLGLLGQTSVGGYQVGKPLEVIDLNTPFKDPLTVLGIENGKIVYKETPYELAHYSGVPVPLKMLDSKSRKRLSEMQGNWNYLGVPVQVFSDGAIIYYAFKALEGGHSTGSGAKNNAPGINGGFSGWNNGVVPK